MLRLRRPWRGGRDLARDNVLIQPAAFRVRLGVDLSGKVLSKPLILTQRLLALSGRRVEPHQTAMGFLPRRVAQQKSLQRLDRLRRMAGGLIRGGELGEQPEVLLTQRFSPARRPLLVDVVGQQVVGAKRDGALICGDVPCPRRALGAFLKGVDVDPDAARPEGQDVVLEDQVRLAPPGVTGCEHAAHHVDHFPKIAGRGRRLEVRPEDRHHLFSMEAVPGSQRQQLDEGPRLAQPPLGGRDVARAGGYAEPPEQPDPEFVPRAAGPRLDHADPRRPAPTDTCRRALVRYTAGQTMRVRRRRMSGPGRRRPPRVPRSPRVPGRFTRGS